MDITRKRLRKIKRKTKGKQSRRYKPKKHSKSNRRTKHKTRPLNLRRRTLKRGGANGEPEHKLSQHTLMGTIPSEERNKGEETLSGDSMPSSSPESLATEELQSVPADEPDPLPKGKGEEQDA